MQVQTTNLLGGGSTESPRGRNPSKNHSPLLSTAAIAKTFSRLSNSSCIGHSPANLAESAGTYLHSQKIRGGDRGCVIALRAARNDSACCPRCADNSVLICRLIRAHLRGRLLCREKASASTNLRWSPLRGAAIARSGGGGRWHTGVADAGADAKASAH